MAVDIENKFSNRIDLLIGVAMFFSVLFLSAGFSDDDNDDNDDDDDNGSLWERFWDTGDEVGIDECRRAQTQAHSKELRYIDGLERRSLNELKSIRRKALLWKGKHLSVGYNNTSFLGKHYDVVFNQLYNRAFNNIEVLPVKDIGPARLNWLGNVQSVVIGKRQRFSKFSKFAFDTPIKIYYHEKKEVIMPYDSSYFIDRNKKEVHECMKRLGFTNITLEPIMHVFSRDGYVKGNVSQVKINGRKTFKKNSIYDFDAKVTIVFHSRIL